MKIGDKVRVVAMKTGQGFDIGDVVTCISLEADGWHEFALGCEKWYMDSSEYEPIRTTFQTGKTYTSNNGNKWECIAVKGDVAWLVGCYAGVADGSAYSFKADGSPICLATGSDEYRIKFEPVAEVKYQYTTIEGHPVTIKYTTNDGILDEGSITAEVATF